MNPIARAYWTAKGVGWDNVPRRLLQAARVRSGRLRSRLDPGNFSDQAFVQATHAQVNQQRGQWQQRAAGFLRVPTPLQLQALADDEVWRQHVMEPLESAMAGRYPFFSHGEGQLGWPPNFNRDPMHGLDWPVGEHWLTTAKSGPPRHDIKIVWEPNRLTLAYHLARAYCRDKDERWAAAFWQLFEAWCEQNPPQLSVAWGCGQETAFRLMAVITATVAVLDSEETTDDRLFAVTRFAWQCAARIEPNINYAISQKNNHSLSEALGLWTVGTLFEVFPEAKRWQDKGRRVLASECRRQIYKDGSFVQHSLNYHRVMLDDLMWCLAIAKRCDAELPSVVADRFGRATDWLAQLVDPVSGRVPNYGSNDGANVLPLSCSDYLDYRPTLQAAHRLTHGAACLDTGVWDEKSLWMQGDSSFNQARQPIDRQSRWSAPQGGYFVLRGPGSWAMTRATTYRDRPYQADQLHLDLWHQGVNVLRDAGSFMYYHEDDHWRHYFHATAAHNVPQIDDREQMTKGPRFLWFHWPKAVGDLQRLPDGVDCFVGTLTSKAMPGAQIQRRLYRRGDTYLIADRVTGSSATWRWRLAPIDWQPIQGQTQAWQASIAGVPWAIQILPGPDGACRMAKGYESLYYAEKTTTPVVEHQADHAAAVLLGPCDQISELRGRSFETNTNVDEAVAWFLGTDP